MRHLHTFVLLFFLMGSLSAAPAVLARQTPQPPQAPRPPQTPVAQPLSPSEFTNAHETRDRLNALLDQHPPSLREVVRLDPMLLRNDGYLAMYPSLAAFLQQHPEVGHNPEFFLGASLFSERNGWTPQMEAARALRDVAQFGSVLLIVITITTGVILLIRAAAEHRRWQRASRAQAELNNKLIDRFAASNELLAYLESPHGKALTASLSPGTVTARGTDAPLGRIFGSLQAGSVLAFAGAGLLFISSRLRNLEPVASGIFAVGTVVLMIGIGFLASSAISFVLSRRLGLVPALSSPQGDAPSS